MNSFNDIKESAQEVADNVCTGSLSFAQGKELMGVLREGANFRKMSADYAGAKLIEVLAEEKGIKP